MMNPESQNNTPLAGHFDPFPPAWEAPILLVPYMWIGDFVRCHSVVKVLRQRWPHRPVDMLTTSLCAPLLDYMPGVRKGIVWDLPRRRIPFDQYRALARTMKAEHYQTALVMLRTWKSALAPFLAGIPERVGFIGEGRFLLINDLRWGERKLERMIDRCGVLALPKDAGLPAEWPLPELVVPKDELENWLVRRGLASVKKPVVAFAPGAVGPGKAWPPSHYTELARTLAERGATIWILGGPNERSLARDIAKAGGPNVTDLTGNDLRDAILALAAADTAVTNDSGLMHIAAALGTPTIAVFGPTSPRLWAPLNPLAAVIEPAELRPCGECGKANCNNFKHRRTADIEPRRVLSAIERTLATRGIPLSG